MASRFIPGWLLLLALGAPSSGAAQVIATVNEVAIGQLVQQIAVPSHPQFVGDRYVAFEGSAGAGFKSCWVKDLTTPRGVIRSFNVDHGAGCAISPDARYLAFVSRPEPRCLARPTMLAVRRSVTARAVL